MGQTQKQKIRVVIDDLDRTVESIMDVVRWETKENSDFRCRVISRLIRNILLPKEDSLSRSPVSGIKKDDKGLPF